MENRLEQIIKNIKLSNGERIKVKNFVLFSNNPYGQTPGMVLENLEEFCDENEVVQVTFLNVSKDETRIVVVYEVS